MAKRVFCTKLCDMLGIEYPILSAGMGPTLIGEKTGAPLELVVAVIILYSENTDRRGNFFPLQHFNQYRSYMAKAFLQYF